MSDLFNTKEEKPTKKYTAKDIEVLEGLEPIRKRPGMYIGGTDEMALHHLVAEVVDNSMDEAVAGFANTISVYLSEDGYITIEDNGRGIPVDPHPKFPDKSALEIIVTILHSGGKFSASSYQVSGGLHGVGLAVVNALSEELVIEVSRDKELWRQSYSRGKPTSTTDKIGKSNHNGTKLRFKPDAEIFGEEGLFQPKIIYRMLKNKAYVLAGVTINWKCDESLVLEEDNIPTNETFHFKNGIKDYITSRIEDCPTIVPQFFTGKTDLPEKRGYIEWAMTWTDDENKNDSFLRSYCNTIITPLGGSHENGFKSGILRAMKGFGELVGNRKASDINSDDILNNACAVLSVFITEPQYQGQTKEKLVSTEVTRLIDNAIKNQLDYFLSADTKNATNLLNFIIEKSEERKRKKRTQEMSRSSATKRLRLPGKLADCSRSSQQGTEIFIVEGDSAGGSAKQARNRETQAILPIRGKILNVASASLEKIGANQEVSNLIEALGCGIRDKYKEENLRYEKIIIMTDADVDGSHIATLLMTFFYQEMPELIKRGHLYLALPPLYKLSGGGKTIYAVDEAHKNRLLSKDFKGKSVDIGRFKGLGEMMPSQLKETTMNLKTRTLIKVMLPDEQDEDSKDKAEYTAKIVEQLMGKKPELRFKYIQNHAKFADNLDI